MVRALQVKFVKTAMIAITVLLLAVICAISGIYSASIYREAKWTAQMLADHGGVPAFDDMKGADREEDDWDFEDWESDEDFPEGTAQGEPGSHPPKGKENAGDFLNAVAPINASGEAVKVPELTGSGRVLVLLALRE